MAKRLKLKEVIVLLGIYKDIFTLYKDEKTDDGGDLNQFDSLEECYKYHAKYTLAWIKSTYDKDEIDSMIKNNSLLKIFNNKIEIITEDSYIIFSKPKCAKEFSEYLVKWLKGK